MSRSGLLAIAALTLAYASLAQGIGWNQNAHYALVRALAHGTPVIDRYRAETGDVSWFHGHYYSTKAPGLALLTTPAYFVLDRSGLLRALADVPGASGSAVGALWALGLVGCVLPAALILLLVRRLGEEVEPGFGIGAATAIGAGTLLLPFATLFFDHVLSAALGFAAFAILWLRRGTWSALGAGCLAGLAITSEYPLALVAIALAAYAALGGLRRCGVYAVGVAIGLVPLAAYNWWAFGSPFHLSYSDAVARGGTSGHDVLGANDRGLFGVGWPSLRTAAELLFSHTGLLVLTPVVAMGAVGTVILLRRGYRAEAIVILGLAVAFVTYNSGYVDPFGGWSPGPRFLIPVLPFLAVGLAPAFRRFPATTSALALGSIVFMVLVTISEPLLAHDGRYLERISGGTFDGHGFLPVLPFLLLVGLAVGLTAIALPLRFETGELPLAFAALAGWALVGLVGPRLLHVGAGVVVALAGLVAASVAAVALAQPSPNRP